MKILNRKFLIVSILILVLVYPFPRKRDVSTPDVVLENLRFPKDFVWGASTSSHQVEGGNHNQWTDWEKVNAERLARESEGKFAATVPDWERIKNEATDPQNYISGDAVDHYHRYKEDIALAKSLSLNAYRFSIEWSRIEPEDGRFDETQIVHYRDVVRELRRQNMEPFVTLWHRTNPLWVEAQGGWENSKTIDDYAEYVDKVVSALGEDVNFWMPFNEPVLLVAAGYIDGSIPPEVHSWWRGFKVLDNLAEAHARAYKIIHEKDTDAQVGSTNAVGAFQGFENRAYNNFVAKLVGYLSNWVFLNKTSGREDFVALQYYTRNQVALRFGGKGPVWLEFPNDSGAARKTEMGWEIYPQGIYELVKTAHDRYRKPIYITENGVPDRDDQQRAEYIAEHLYWMQKALAEGVPVKGYFYWSLLDNFEWDKGFWPRFGLIKVDRATQGRTIQPSAREHQKIINQSK